MLQAFVIIIKLKKWKKLCFKRTSSTVTGTEKKSMKLQFVLWLCECQVRLLLTSAFPCLSFFLFLHVTLKSTRRINREIIVSVVTNAYTSVKVLSRKRWWWRWYMLKLAFQFPFAFYVDVFLCSHTHFIHGIRLKHSLNISAWI